MDSEGYYDAYDTLDDDPRTGVIEWYAPADPEIEEFIKRELEAWTSDLFWSLDVSLDPYTIGPRTPDDHGYAWYCAYTTIDDLDTDRLDNALVFDGTYYTLDGPRGPVHVHMLVRICGGDD